MVPIPYFFITCCLSPSWTIYVAQLLNFILPPPNFSFVGRAQDMDCEQWMVDFVRSGGFAQFCEAILARGLFGDGRPEEMVDAQQACLVSHRTYMRKMQEQEL